MRQQRKTRQVRGAVRHVVSGKEPVENTTGYGGLVDGCECGDPLAVLDVGEIWNRGENAR